MKSKAHYKKCEELGLTPLPPSVDDDGADDDTEGASMTSGDHTSTVPGDSDSDDLSDGEDGENDSSGKLETIFIQNCIVSDSLCNKINVLNFRYQ